MVSDDELQIVAGKLTLSASADATQSIQAGAGQCLAAASGTKVGKGALAFVVTAPCQKP